MSTIPAVQAGIDYIEANLHGELDLSDVARSAGLSRWHYQRIFKALTNETLKSYVRARRLDAALNSLIRTDQRILDISLASGYESQESFTRAFRKAFGITPGDARKIGSRNCFPEKIRIDQSYLRHVHKNVSLEPEFQHRPPVTLVGLKTRFFGEDSEKNNIADRLPPLWSAFLPRIGEIENRVEGLCFGVIEPVAHDSEQLDYHSAVAVSGISRLPPDMVCLEIPATHYALFAHRGPPETLNDTVNYIYSSWLLNSGKRHTGGADLELYDERYRDNSVDSLMYYAIPVN